MFGNLFQGREVGKQRSHGFMLAVGVATLLLAAALFKVGYDAAVKVPGRGYYNLNAEFTNAENVANHYEVRIGGERVGQVLEPEVHDGKARLHLRISDKYKPLLSDTTLRVRLRSAVGVRFVEILPGTRGTPLPEGATIPVTNTRPPVALDKVLGTFDASTRDKVRTFLNELGAGTLSRSRDLNEAVAGAPEFFGSLGSVSAAITRRPGSMGRLIRAADGTADAFDPVRREIADGFETETAALKPFSEARDDVRALLVQAPAALDRLRASLPAVAGLIDETARLARDARPTLQRAPASLRSTTVLLRDSVEPLANARRTLELAGRAVSPTLGLLGAVNPVLPGLEQALDSLYPTVKYVGPRACGISDAMTGWNQAMKYGDQHSNFIRFQFLGAARPDVIGGATETPRVPGPDGKDVLDRFYLTEPYPEPCDGQYGESGPPRPTVQESAKDITYTRARQPGFEAPGYHGPEGGR